MPVSGTTLIVPERTASMGRNDKMPVRMLNEAGPKLKVPFFENIIWVDKRVRGLDMDGLGFLYKGGAEFFDERTGDQATYLFKDITIETYASRLPKTNR